MSEPQNDAPKAARPLEEPEPIGEPRTNALRRLIAIVDRLREPDGCPWDRSQTLESIGPHLVEEAHELLEAIEAGADEDIVEEAGDLLMGLVLLARTGAEAERFDLAAMAHAVSDKLIRRHPHVFGGTPAGSAEEALGRWEAVKREERAARKNDASALAGVPVALPALQRAHRLRGKAVAAGWTAEGESAALEEVETRLGGLRAAIETEDREALERELGEALLAAAFLGGEHRIDPERALRGALRGFEAGFRRKEASFAKGKKGENPGSPAPPAG